MDSLIFQRESETLGICGGKTCEINHLFYSNMSPRDFSRINYSRFYISDKSAISSRDNIGLSKIIISINTAVSLTAISRIMINRCQVLYYRSPTILHESLLFCDIIIFNRSITRQVGAKARRFQRRSESYFKNLRKYAHASLFPSFSPTKKKAQSWTVA